MGSVGRWSLLTGLVALGLSLGPAASAESDPIDEEHGLVRTGILGVDGRHGPGCESGWYTSHSGSLPARPVGVQGSTTGLTIWYTQPAGYGGYDTHSYTYCTICISVEDALCISTLLPPS